MAGETTTTYAALLKEYYTDDAVEDATYTNNPLLALVKKFTEFYGELLAIPIIYGNPQGRSASISTAITNKSASLTKVFNITRVSDYAVASIGREVMLASEKDKGAFMRAAVVNTDGAINQITRSLALAVYGSGSGAIGRVGSGQTTATITLLDIKNITHFEVNMVVTTSATDGTGTIKAGTATITAIDRDAGTITSGSVAFNDATKISTISANDYIFVAGDYAAKISGLSGWIPSSAPGATAFFGVDRSVDTTRLGGVRYDGSSDSIEEALINGQSKVAELGEGIPTHCMVHNSQYRALIKSLGSKVMYTDQSANARVFFPGVVVQGDYGQIKVIADRNCQTDTAWMLQLDQWKLYSLLEAPHIFDKGNDQEMLREATSDGYELRVGYYAQLGSRKPGSSGRITLASAT